MPIRNIGEAEGPLDVFQTEPVLHVIIGNYIYVIVKIDN